ncbi:DMT family transporter [Comamonadaceae bacterium M7527]|nr:DMT family transporter [Comamonadaceae bacterium M7527]
MKPWLAFTCLATSMALVGSYVALSKPLVAVFPVFLLAWLRFAIGSVAMARWLQKPSTEKPLSAATKKLLFLESFLGNVLFSVCMLYGVSLTSASAAGVMLSAIPAMVALQSAVFLKERLSTRSLLAIACAIVGIGLYASISHTDVDANYPYAWLGNLLVFAAVCCEAAYAVIGKHLTQHLSAKRIASVINVWGLALTTPAGLYWLTQFDFSVVSPSDWGLLVFYALAASVLTVWLWMTGLQGVQAHQAGVFTVVLPISAATIGVLFLGDVMTVLQAVAFGIALMGVVLATTGKGHA